MQTSDSSLDTVTQKTPPKAAQQETPPAPALVQQATPPAARTPMEALLQRRVQFKETADKAKADGNS